MNIIKNQINEILIKFEYNSDSLIPILLEVQKLNDEKYISREVAIYIADEINVTHSRIYEVMTFFDAINTEPKGRNHIQICESSVCKINGMDSIEECLVNELKINVGEVTKDKEFSLDYTPCFGACDVAPALRINKKVYGNLTPDKIKVIIEKLRGDTIESV